MIAVEVTVTTATGRVSVAHSAEGDVSAERLLNVTVREVRQLLGVES